MKNLFLAAAFIATAAHAQTDYALFRKTAGLDQKSYPVRVNSSLWSINSGGDFVYLAQSNFANASHVHTFASLTSKPTTIGGYGITDFESLGDARWSLIAHTHLSADVTDASTGGNDVADDGLLAKYNTEGQLHGSVVNSSTAAVWGSSAGTGYAGLFTGGTGTTRLGTPVAPIEVNASGLVIDAARINAGNAVHIGGLTGTGLDISDAGVLTWTSAGGASGSRTGLGLGTLATQSGTFSGTHSGTSSGTNTGDQTTVTGNAGTATALQTARNINGVAFDGTADITVTAAAGTLTGTTLNSTVVSSSLTSVATISAGRWHGDVIEVLYGGTGASTEASARDNLGLKIGTDVQGIDAELTALASLTSGADRLPYFTGSGTAAVADFTSTARLLLDDGSTSAMRTTLGLGTIATQDASTVTITGGSITGITDLAIADGGTGASSASAARTSLGLVIATDVEAHDADLTTIGGLSPSNDDFLQRKAGAWANRTVALVKSDLGLSGSNTGDQTITLTGPITGSGTGSFATTVAETELAALATTTSAADKVPYFTGSGTASTTDLKLGTSASYTGTVTWTCGLAPATPTIRQYYTQTGNVVNWTILLTYTTAGTTCTNLSLTFPTEFPTPAIPTGFTGADVRIWNCDGARFLATPTAAGITFVSSYFVSRNSGDTGFVIGPTAAWTSSTVRQITLGGRYFTQ